MLPLLQDPCAAAAAAGGIRIIITCLSVLGSVATIIEMYSCGDHTHVAPYPIYAFLKRWINLF